MKKCFIALIGGTLLLLGVALLVLPGPGVPIIAAGVAFLATELTWVIMSRSDCQAGCDAGAA